MQRVPHNEHLLACRSATRRPTSFLCRSVVVVGRPLVGQQRHVHRFSGEAQQRHCMRSRRQ
ncbi:unnamed protein product [Soboliphyme baturini]|uniref:DUF1534 domain-containing protein n=1 Tax=Soboliphyme baturini TaxID=241478 RepID=A0A183IRQ0_9BILA|nr:unnamed protein product [Soboliphyme baturini]